MMESGSYPSMFHHAMRGDTLSHSIETITWLMMIIWSDPSMFHDAVSPWSLHIYHYEAMQGQGPHFPPTRKATIHIHRGEGGKGSRWVHYIGGGVGGGLAKPGSYIYKYTCACVFTFHGIHKGLNVRFNLLILTNRAIPIPSNSISQAMCKHHMPQQQLSSKSPQEVCASANWLTCQLRSHLLHQLVYHYNILWDTTCMHTDIYGLSYDSYVIWYRQNTENHLGITSSEFQPLKIAHNEAVFLSLFDAWPTFSSESIKRSESTNIL